MNLRVNFIVFSSFLFLTFAFAIISSARFTKGFEESEKRFA